MGDSARPSVRVASFPLGPNTQIGISVSNLITICVVVAGGALAWAKIPSEEKVTAISEKTSQAAVDAFKALNAERERERARQLEEAYKANQAELAKMNKTMERMLILMAGGSAAQIKTPAGRRAAEIVKNNLERGHDPLAGSGFRGIVDPEAELADKVMDALNP